MNCRKQLYRQAFFCIDKDYSGTLSFRELDQFGKFMLGQKWSQATAVNFLKKYDVNSDGQLDFEEFVSFCETCVVDQSDDIDHPERMVTGYINFRDRQDKAWELRWQSRALKIDYFARWTIPLGYLAFFLRTTALPMADLQMFNEDMSAQIGVYFYGLIPLSIAIGLFIIGQIIIIVSKRQRSAAQKFKDQTSVFLDVAAPKSLD